MKISKVPPMLFEKCSRSAVMSRCAVEEIGRNSVIPSTTPSITTSHQTRAVPLLRKSPRLRIISGTIRSIRLVERRASPVAIGLGHAFMLSKNPFTVMLGARQEECGLRANHMNSCASILFRCY
jgi:hypothetical protein